MTVVVLAAWLALRIAEHPVPLDFLTPYIEDALTTPDGRLAVKLDGTVLGWNDDTKTLEIRALGVQAGTAGQSLVAAVPEMSVSLSG
ncbi:MAG TPA: hypothetical protein HPQ04_11750, partial [Rhodospirillaceae bacterium]|nr:hypothetical protein [Rhodospirillaceae bacterium]